MSQRTATERSAVERHAAGYVAVSEVVVDEMWRERWRNGQIGFHRAEVSAALRDHPGGFLADGPHRVLVPLCGKTVDLAWLAGEGHAVVGVELSEIAAAAVFSEAGAEPRVERRGAFTVFSAPSLTVLQGDWFAVTPEVLAAAFGPEREAWPVAVWDRAAMIALPPEVRGPYVAHLRALAGPGATILLETLSYTPGTYAGPPFSVTLDEVRDVYAGRGVTTYVDEAIDIEPRYAEVGVTWMRRAVSRVTGPAARDLR